MIEWASKSSLKRGRPLYRQQGSPKKAVSLYSAVSPYDAVYLYSAVSLYSALSLYRAVSPYSVVYLYSTVSLFSVVSLYSAVSLYQVVKIAWRGWGVALKYSQPEMNKAASPLNAVILLWHTAAFLGDPYIVSAAAVYFIARKYLEQQTIIVSCFC